MEKEAKNLSERKSYDIHMPKGLGTIIYSQPTTLSNSRHVFILPSILLNGKRFFVPKNAFKAIETSTISTLLKKNGFSVDQKEMYKTMYPSLIFSRIGKPTFDA